ncbi:MAG TPA: BadF/BadG/BcrA/BcrD ATPase family protein [Candidatus Kapabacteria bacterium]|jgi:N-acetylglucosamine kinase-like BadF-type ATPase
MMFVGIDGGGTTTRLFIQHCDEDAQYFEFPISLKVRNGDFSTSAEKLRKIVAQTFTDRSHYHASIKLVLGLSGMSQDEDQEQFRSALLALPEFQDASVQIETDATLTLRSVLAEGEEGILMIAGTGSVVFYQPEGHPARRIGGWGPLLSDEGSGYRIGLRALRHYLNVMDNVFPRDALSQAIAMRIADSDATPRTVTARAETDPSFVASFAQDVFEKSATDHHIREIAINEIVDLVTLLFPIMAPGVLSGTKPYNLYLSGGIARQPIVTHVIEEAFQEGNLQVHIVNERAPAYKALELAHAL